MRNEQIAFERLDKDVESNNFKISDDFDDDLLEMQVLEDMHARGRHRRWYTRFHPTNAISRVVLLLCALLLVLILGTVGVYSSRRLRSRMMKYQKCVPTIIDVPTVVDLTLEEKLGQMTQIETHSLEGNNAVAKYLLGSVLSGGGGAPVTGNNPVNWADMVDHYQSQAMKTRLRIPILYGVDAVHGHNNVYGTTIFPHNVGIGATRNPTLAKNIAMATAKEVIATGIRWDFAPCIAVCRDPRWGRCYESFGEDPNLVRSMTTAVEGYQQDASATTELGLTGDVVVAATVKHYVGDGGTTGGKDQGNTEVDEQTLRTVHLPGYIDAIQKDVLSVMISYSSWNGAKMHGNRYLVNDVLKGELGFRGVVVSDWHAIDQLPGDYNQQVRDSINAGLDMIMVPKDYEGFLAALHEEVKTGRIPMERIDDAVQRILTMKRRLGLFENACAKRELLASVGENLHRELAKTAVMESLVLLKNTPRKDDGGKKTMFPLAKSGVKIVVVGKHANSIGLQCGGWTITWQGGVGNTTKGTTILEGIQDAVDLTSTTVVYAESPTGKETGDFGVVVVGEQPYAEYYGDSSTLKLDDASVDAVSKVCDKMPCVVILISGRPLILDPTLLAKMDALIAAWLPGSEAGSGIAYMLFGAQQEYDFKGRLPISWPKSVDQLPMPKGSLNYDPHFAFGFGLDKSGNQLPPADGEVTP